MIETTFTVPLDHPAFAGHFPGRPILPGVVLLARAVAAAGEAAGLAAPLTVAAAKFLRPVGPGAALVVACEADARGGWRFEIRAGDAVVCAGSLQPGQPGGRT